MQFSKEDVAKLNMRSDLLLMKCFAEYILKTAVLKSL